MLRESGVKFGFKFIELHHAGEHSPADKGDALPFLQL